MSTLAVKYCITFEATGSPDARLNSLEKGGPLKLDPEHIFAVKLGLSPNAGGWVEITYREVEFIIGKPSSSRTKPSSTTTLCGW